MRELEPEFGLGYGHDCEQGHTHKHAHEHAPAQEPNFVSQAMSLGLTSSDRPDLDSSDDEMPYLADSDDDELDYESDDDDEPVPANEHGPGNRAMSPSLTTKSSPGLDS